MPWVLLLAWWRSGTTAIEKATARAEQGALALAIASGAQQPKVTSTITKHHLPDAQNDDGLLSATVTAEAVGRPSA
jgi:hypothetical protein